MMLQQTAVQVQLAGTAFTKVSMAVNNPTPLHVDHNNVGLTVVWGFDVSKADGEVLTGGNHVIVDDHSEFALVVEDHANGVHMSGPCS
eukprot:6198723-Pleurochrysis_carterae.AAC.2